MPARTNATSGLTSGAGNALKIKGCIGEAAAGGDLG